MTNGDATSVTPTDIEAAAAAIAPCIRATPIIRLAGREITDADDLADITLVLKLEHLQHSGSFKARGAANFMATRPIGPSGVVAASGGNHGAAVAWAAKTFGHPANIFVPTIAAPTKVERLRDLDATVHQGGAVFQDAQEASIAWRRSNDAVAVHPYDDPTILAGAGTCSRELERQAGLLDAVLVACGGGGLAGGAAAWFGHRVPVIACETEGTATFASAKAAGGPTDIEVSGIAADALGATRLGANPWRALEAVDAGSVVVTDEELLFAQQLLWNELRLVVEPAAAAPIAALVTGRWRPAKRTSGAIGIVLCGANTDPRSVVRNDRGTGVSS